MDRRLKCTVAALVMASAAAAVAIRWSTRVAGGSDSYGYVSQADLWLKRDLFIDQSFAAQVPWPMARWTFTPLGYRPEVDGYHIVPQYSPGLPMLMAAAKAIAGQCAVFLVVPLAVAILVLTTYAIAATLGRPLTGLAAAWLVVTSPTMLFMSMAPMSDVPAAAAWAMAIWLTLVATPGASIAAGIAAAIAILIRPNLAPLVAILAIAYAARRDWRGLVAFGALSAAGAVAIGVINARLYGSPLRSGYDLADAFAPGNIIPNLLRYGGWLIAAETPFAVAGLVWLVWQRRWLFAAFTAAVWAIYLVYVPWDAWWYLRFLLPTWPLMAFGTASFIAALYESGHPLLRRLAPALLLVIGLVGLDYARRHDVFTEAVGESKYVEVARVVESLTRPEDVIIASQHSGTLRYYAGRLTLRWDTGDPDWLDRTVAWLAAHGHHPYLVLEEQEIQALREKSATVSVIGRADWTPMVSFRGGQVKMFDAILRDRNVPAVQNKPTFTVDGCAPPKSQAYEPRLANR